MPRRNNHSKEYYPSNSYLNKCVKKGWKSLQCSVNKLCSTRLERNDSLRELKKKMEKRWKIIMNVLTLIVYRRRHVVLYCKLENNF